MKLPLSFSPAVSRWRKAVGSFCTIGFESLCRAENARWPEEQKYQQHRESRHVLQSGPESEDREGLRQTKRNTAKKCAERSAKATDDGGNEAADRERSA